MEKLKLHTPDFTDANIARIAELFPGCVTETRDEQGRLKRAIDFDLLRQELSDQVIDGPRERYQLDWPGKREALLAANAPIAKTLRPCREESVDFDTTRNLFIEGDNLDALKLIQETYLSQVKLIYIDPPYNTGNQYIYNDDFKQETAAYLSESLQVGWDEEKLTANPESAGRFHSNWLSMLFPRLKLARNLLSDNGAIFISIDENEVHNLRGMCDEVFGAGNSVTIITWQKRYTRSNNTVGFTSVVEYVVVYQKSASFVVNLLPRTEEADARYSNPDNDPRGVWKGASFLNPATPQERPNLCYEIRNPNTGEVTRPTTNAWRKQESEYRRLQDENRLYWGDDGTSPVPSVKMFLSEARGMTPINFWVHGYAGNTDSGTRDAEEVLGKSIFSNPKPVQLMRRILEHGSDSDCIVMDFFAGSGTLAQAVLDANRRDGGHRRFILVQQPEAVSEKSMAREAGFANIAEVCKERLRRAGNRLKNANDGQHLADLDVGFRVLKIGTSNMKDVYHTPDALQQADLFDQVDNIKPDRTTEDLLFQVLLDWGVDLALPIRSETLAGRQVFFVDTDALAACFETGIDEPVMRAIAERRPLRVVFRDAGFSDDSMKINCEQIFKTLSPATEVRAI